MSVAPIASHSTTARSHWPPLPHALIAALYEMVVGTSPSRSISASNATARSHSPLFSHALIAALYVYSLGVTPYRRSAPRSRPSALFHPLSFPSRATAAETCTTFGPRPSASIPASSRWSAAGDLAALMRAVSCGSRRAGDRWPVGCGLGRRTARASPRAEPPAARRPSGSRSRSHASPSPPSRLPAARSRRNSLGVSGRLLWRQGMQRSGRVQGWPQSGQPHVTPSLAPPPGVGTAMARLRGAHASDGAKSPAAMSVKVVARRIVVVSVG
mmetsp:Transcript_110045/g.320357  ORF Transcript_110045/g.320357 Transcript_110045/m.320357 type:complete len:271 (-) Transcript_110045:267-1079(-)